MDLMNFVPDSFYKSESEKENAAKKIWPEILYMCPAHVDFQFHDVYFNYLSQNESVKEQEIFEIKERIENVLRSKELITVGITGNLMDRLTKKGVELKDGVVKHRVLSSLFFGLSLFRIPLSRLCNVEPNVLDYLTAEMKEDLSINKKSAMSKDGDDYFVSITDKGKGYFLKQFYLQDAPVGNLFSVNHTINNDHSVKIEGDGNLLAQNSHLDKARIKPAIEKHSNITPANTPKRSLLEIITWIVGIAGGLIVIYEFIIKKLF